MTGGPRIEDLVQALNLPARPSSDYDLNPGQQGPAGSVLRPAGVLIAISDVGGRLEVWLTKRASGLKHHPGQIAFPGGKVDEGDRDVVAAALREAQEEVGLDPGHVEILGTMPAHETVTGFSVTPVLARITQSFVPLPEPGEVEEVFSVPLAFVTDRANFRIERRLWRGTWRSFYVVPHGPYYIWGATARMLRALTDSLEGPGAP